MLQREGSEDSKKAKLPQNSPLPAGGIELRDALTEAEALLQAAIHIEGRSIGALWKAHENGQDCVYVDIWPPYEGEQPPAGNTSRLAIRVNDQGAAEWSWVEGTVLVDRKPPLVRAMLVPDVHVVSPDGRRRVVLPPDAGSSPPDVERPAEPPAQQ
jgi:hypothetical protein